MPDIDWAAATDTLDHISREQFTRFLAGPVRERVYAVGFFLDPTTGDVLPVANTIEHHLKGYTTLVKEYGPTDEYEYLWDSGNWEYAAGLAPSGSDEFTAFDSAWTPFREAIGAAADGADDAELQRLEASLRSTCTEALRRLAADGVFAGCPELMGYVVQAPTDPREGLVAEQARVTAAVTSAKPPGS
jgi:hypothetical protein